MNETQITLTTPDGPMNAFISFPEQRENAPAILVIQEAFGVNPYLQDVCRRLSREGFIALAPELYHRAGAGVTADYSNYEHTRPIMSQLTNSGMEGDLGAVLKYLTLELKVPSQKIATIGFCMGGFVAFLAACRLKIATAVCFYGAGLVHPRPGMQFTPLMSEASKIQVPVFCIFGGKDTAIPLAEVDTVRHELSKQPQLGHQILVYPEAGHGFFCHERPSYHPKSAEDAWKKVLAWLNKTVR